MLPPAYNGPMRYGAWKGHGGVVEWLIIVGVMAIGIPAVAWFAQDRLIFFPQPLAGTAHLPAHAEPLDLVAADGSRLAGWRVAGTADPAPLILYFGGNAEEVSWTLADARWPREWTIVGLNYRGYGASEGVPSEHALVADALALFDAVASRTDVDARRIVAFGRSLGTGVAAQLAVARPLAGAVLVSPFDSLVAVGRTHYPWLPVGLLLRHRFDAAEAARSARMPLLVIVAERDSIIPIARSRALFDAWAGPKRWQSVPGADHNDLGVENGFWHSIRQFLAELPPRS